MFKTVSTFFYQLLFTRDDDLDMLQILFATIVIVTLLIAWKVTTGVGMTDTVRVEGLITLRWLTSLLVVTAVPKWLVPFIINAKTVNPLPVSKNLVEDTSVPTEQTS